METGTEKYFVPGYGTNGLVEFPAGMSDQERRQALSKAYGYDFSTYPIHQIKSPSNLPVQPPAEDKGTWFHEWIGRDLERGWDLTQAMGDGLSAIAANILDAPEWEAHALQDYQKEMEEAAQNPAKVASYTDIESLSDALIYLKEGILETLPLMVPSLVTGGVGGVVGATAGKAIASRAVDVTAKNLLEKLVSRKVASYVPQLVAKGIPAAQAQIMAQGMAVKFFSGPFAQGVLKNAIGRAATIGQTTGAALGAWAGSTGVEAGLIAGEQFDVTGEIDPAYALGYGAIAGSLDALPAFMVLKKVFGPAANDIKKGFIRRFGVEGAKQLLAEGSTEFVQTFVEKMGVSALSGQPVFTEENFHEAVDAALKAGSAGFVLGAGAEALRKTPSTQKPDPTQTSQAVERTDLRTGEGQRGANDLFKLQGSKLAGSVLNVGPKNKKQKLHFTNPTTYENASIDQVLFTTIRRLKANRKATISPETEALLENHYGPSWRLVGESFVNEVENKRNQGAAITKIEPLAGSDTLLNYAVPAPSIPLKNIKGDKNAAFAKVDPDKIFDEKVYSFTYEDDKATLVGLQKGIAEGKSDTELLKEFSPKIESAIAQMKIPGWSDRPAADKKDTYLDALKALKIKLGVPEKTNKPEFDSWKRGIDIMTGKVKSPAATEAVKKALKPPPPKDRLDRIALAYQNIKAKQYQKLGTDGVEKALTNAEIKEALDDAGLKTHHYDQVARAVLEGLAKTPLQIDYGKISGEAAVTPPVDMAQFEDVLRKQTYKPVRPKSFLPGQGEFEALPVRQRNIERLWSWLSAINDQEKGVPFIRFELLWATGVDPLKNLNAYMDHWPKLMDFLVDQAREDINQADQKVVRRKLLSVFKLIKQKLELPEFNDPQFVYWRNDIVEHYRRKSRLTKEVRDQIDHLLLEKINLNNLWVNPKQYANHKVIESKELTDEEVAATWPQLGQPVKVNFTIDEGDTGPRINYSIQVNKEAGAPEVPVLSTKIADSTLHNPYILQYLPYDLNPAMIKWFGFESSNNFSDFIQGQIADKRLREIKDVLSVLYGLDFTDPITFINPKDTGRVVAFPAFNIPEDATILEKKAFEYHLKNAVRAAFYSGKIIEIPFTSKNVVVVRRMLGDIGFSQKAITAQGQNLITINPHHPENTAFHKLIKDLEPSGFAKWSHKLFYFTSSYANAYKQVHDIVNSLVGKQTHVEFVDRAIDLDLSNPNRGFFSGYINQAAGTISAAQTFTNIPKGSKVLERAVVSILAFDTASIQGENKPYLVGHEAWHSFFESVRVTNSNKTYIPASTIANFSITKDFNYMESPKGIKELAELWIWLLENGHTKNINSGYISKLEMLLHPYTNQATGKIAPDSLKILESYLSDLRTRTELQADAAGVLNQLYQDKVKIPGFKYASMVERIFDFFKRLAQTLMGSFPTYSPENVVSIYERYIKSKMVSEVEELQKMMGVFRETKTAEDAFINNQYFKGTISQQVLDENGNPRPIWLIRLTNDRLNKQIEQQKGIDVAQTREAARELSQKLSLQYGHTLTPDTSENGLKAWLSENKDSIPSAVSEFLSALTFDEETVSFTNETLDPIVDRLRPSEIRMIQNLAFVKKLDDAEVYISRGYLKASKNIAPLQNYTDAYINKQIHQRASDIYPSITINPSITIDPKTDKGKLVQATQFVPEQPSGAKNAIEVGSGRFRKLRKINKEKFTDTVALNAWSRWARSMHDIAQDHPEFARYWTLASERQRDRTFILEGMMIDVSNNENRLKALTQLKRTSQRNIFKALEVVRRLDRTHLDQAPDGTYQIQVPDMADSEDPLALYDIQAKPGELIKLSKEESAALDKMVEGISFGLDQIIKAYKINLNFSPDTTVEFLKNELATHAETVKFLKETDDPKAAEIEAAYNRMMDIITDIETLESYKGRHYMPLVRGGDMGISVHKIGEDGGKGDLVYFKTFTMDKKGKREWEVIEAQLKRDFPADQYLISSKAFELTDNYKRVAAADALGGLESLASLLPDKMRQSYEAIHKVLVEEAMTRGFKKHLTNARNIAGYDNDIVSAYANFANGVANFASNITYKNAITKSLNVLEKHPQLHKMAFDLEEYLTSREEEYTRLRNIGFLMYLGFNITSGLLQTFTLPLVYVGYVSQFMSPLVAAAKLRKLPYHAAPTQYKELKQLDKVPNRLVSDDLKELYQMGYLKPMMTLDQAGFAVSQTAQHMRWFGEGWRQLVQSSGYIFNKIETASRVTAARIILEQAYSDPKFMDRFNAAHIKDEIWQEMLRQGNGTPKNAAIHVLERTFGIYGKTSRPRVMRGLGTAVFQFNTYPQQMIELMVRLARGTKMNKKAFAFMMLALLVTSGVQGWPGLENLKVLIETISKDWFGTTLDLETEMRKLIVEYTDSVEAAQIITRGLIPSAFGTDIGRRVGLGILPAAENILAAIGAYGDNSTLDAFGVAGSLLQFEPWMQAYRDKGLWESLNQAPFVPTSVKNIIDATVVWPENGVRSNAGDEILGTDELQFKHLMMKAIGINPTVVAERRLAARAARLEGSAMDEIQSSYYNRLARARVASIKANRIGDVEAAKDAQSTYQQLRNEITEYNKTAAPSRKIKIDPEYLKSLIKRLLAPNLKGIIKSQPSKARRTAEELTKLYDLMAY